MTRDEDITVSDTLGRTEHWVERFNRSPIAEEMALLVVRPRMAAEVVLVVNVFVEVEVW